MKPHETANPKLQLIYKKEKATQITLQMVIKPQEKRTKAEGKDRNLQGLPRGTDSILGQGAKTPHALRSKTKHGTEAILLANSIKALKMVYVKKKILRKIAKNKTPNKKIGT